MTDQARVRARRVVVAGLALAAVVGGAYAWFVLRDGEGDAALASGNGRIEAVEIDVSTKLPGRVAELYVAEGQFVRAGEPLARMDVESLTAQLAEARANARRAAHAVASANALVALRRSEVAAAEALVVQQQSEQDAARRRLVRTAALAADGALPEQELDDVRARVRSAEAAVAAAQAQVAASRAAVAAAEAERIGARSAAEAAEATVQRIAADLADATLRAPRDGRVQYVIARPGEVLGAGGKVLNLVDLSDVYMSFFLPETLAGRVALGAEARIVLDAIPAYVLPARISYVASTAQFTPKTVETAVERQKLMFRVKAQIDRTLLERYLQQVKTGLPGVAWVKLDPAAAWPEQLVARVPG